MNTKHNAYIIDSTSLNDRIENNNSSNKTLALKLRSISNETVVATITIPFDIVEQFYILSAQHQQKVLSIQGFEKGNVPLEYIKKNYRETLIAHTQEILFKFYGINFLYQQIHEQKLIVAGEPRLIEVSLIPEHEAFFSFELTIITDQTPIEWKHLPFNAPKRKRYKDLDKQVKNFIETEKFLENNESHESIKLDDWICFSVIIVNAYSQPLAAHLPQQFWLHIGKEEIEGPLRTLFLRRKKGDHFITENRALQEYFSNQLDSCYFFSITIEEVIPSTFIDFESIKQHFKIKTNKALHQKLIEIFSYRNDVSQRRAIAQETLGVLLSKNSIKPPLQMVLRKQEDIITLMQESADYNVYRTQKSFNNYVVSLAERQCCEEIIIDHIAINENITVSDSDVYHYLNLYKKARTKEFIYFKIPSFTLQNQEVPASAQELMRYCLREKTLNYIIYYLTKD